GWLPRDYLPLFPRVPERTRLARLFKTHTAWTARFLATPTVLGVADTYGSELIHPMREGRSPAQMGKKGYSHHRWIVGGKLCFILNQWGLICAGDCAPANVHDTHFQPLLAQLDGQMIVLTDTGFQAKTGDPGNMKVCPRGTWNTRMLVETVLSMLTTGYCWRTPFKVLGVLFLGKVSPAFLPSKKACGTHKFRYFCVRQQYLVVFCVLSRVNVCIFGKPVKEIRVILVGAVL